MYLECMGAMASNATEPARAQPSYITVNLCSYPSLFHFHSLSHMARSVESVGTYMATFMLFGGQGVKLTETVRWVDDVGSTLHTNYASWKIRQAYRSPHDVIILVPFIICF